MRRPLLLAFALLVLLAAAPSAEAGGGPETTLIVVNEDSPTSWRIANTYARLRGIPTTHICPIPAPPGLVTISVDDFRERIWKPIEAFIAKHGLEDEIDTIAYSADFPYGVDYRKDFELKPKESGRDKLNWPPIASLTGLTYLHRHVKAKDREYLALNANQYLRVDQDGEMMPGHGFRHAYAWVGATQKPEFPPEDPDTPDRYYLSTMLGFTGIQGNTVGEIERYLTAAAKADGTAPDGTVYLMVNKDVRARTRMPQFEDTAAALQRLGAKVEILEAGKDGQDGKCPVDKGDVMGCVAGIAGFDWTKSKSSFLGGAIAEHLTSFGARFDGSGQTKISEYLRAGAAGSSGAVAEPYALWQKFPLATLHVHYREGCSLAESFFQTVAGPYQLLVVGDPLARPYATFATVTCEVPKKLVGKVDLTATVAPAEGKAVRELEWWLGGQRIGETKPDAAFSLDTTALADGAHELRIVAIEDSAIETRSSTTKTIRIANGSRTATIKAPKKPTPWGETLKLTGKAKGAKEVVVISGHRELGKAKRIGASTWKLEFDSRLLGEGTTTVQARTTAEDGSVVLSPFADVVVGPPGAGEERKTKRSKKKRGKKAKAAKPAGKPGLRIVATDAKGKEHTFAMPILGNRGKQRFLTELRKKVKGNPKTIHLTGEIEIKDDGVYRFALNAAGKLVMTIDGRVVFEGEDLTFGTQAYTTVSLPKGWHKVDITYTPSGNGDLSVWLGGDVVSGPLMGKTLRH